MIGHKIQLLRTCLLFTVFLALPLLEWRYIPYNFFGVHAISPFTILYFILAFLAAVTRRTPSTNKAPSKEFKVYIYSIYVTLILFVLAWQIFSADNTAGATTFSIIGMVLLFISTHFIFCEYGSYIWRATSQVVASMAILYPLAAILFIIFINGSSWIGYVDVINQPNFTFAIRPYQLAMIATFTTLLGSAVWIGSNKTNHVFWAIPLMGYVIAVTGSRSGLIGFWMFWLILCVYVVAEKIKIDGKKMGQNLAMKLICSVALGALVFTLFPKTILSNRVMSLMASGPLSKTPIPISIPSESARLRLWQMAMISGPASGVVPRIDATHFGSFHNVFLDIYVSSGYPPLFLFLLFLVITAIALIRSLYNSESYRERIFRFALLLCFAELSIQALINPVLGFSSAWIMMGMMAASITKPYLLSNVE